eukprot:GHVS01104185.1.p1 GENE.GHVS01104185.1~~GHVS01104185.1.p1  ORF type:complete len:372 (+),score=45.33 GHVS01104185.1:1317-2432(+)
MGVSMHVHYCLALIGWLFGESESGSESRLSDPEEPGSQLPHHSRNSQASMVGLADSSVLTVVYPDSSSTPKPEDNASKLVEDDGEVAYSLSMKPHRPDSPLVHCEDDLEADGGAGSDGDDEAAPQDMSHRRSLRLGTNIKQAIHIFLRQATGQPSITSTTGGTNNKYSATGTAQLCAPLPSSSKPHRAAFRRSTTGQAVTSTAVVVTSPIEAADSTRYQVMCSANIEATQQRHKRMVTELEHRFDFSVGDPQLNSRSRQSRLSHRRMSEGGHGPELSRVSVLSTGANQDEIPATSDLPSKPDSLNVCNHKQHTSGGEGWGGAWTPLAFSLCVVSTNKSSMPNIVCYPDHIGNTRAWQDSERPKRSAPLVAE